jgi:hypothetical protein
MHVTRRVSMYGILLAASLFLYAAPAAAQFQPRPLNDPATGETYHIEGAIGVWFPTADMSIASGGSGGLAGIPGDLIDLKADLGLEDKRFPEFRLEVRPVRHHKLRFEYIPISYEQTATLTRDVVFNGIRFNAGSTVASMLDWKAYRFSYEGDFVATDRGFVGVVLDLKYTDVNASLGSQINAQEFAHAKAPIPAIGATGRYYVVPNISVTAELTGFRLGWLPKSVIKDDSGHYVDVNVYGTLNFTNNIGLQVGYRAFDVGYLVTPDSGNFTLKGAFVGVVARY